MIDRGNHNLLGILVDAVDYEAAVDRVLDAAREHRGAAISALAVHGIMTGVLDPIHRYRLNRFDLIVPDGQPVRWALNLMYGARLEDRVYGPELTLRVCERAAGKQRDASQAQPHPVRARERTGAATACRCAYRPGGHDPLA